MDTADYRASLDAAHQAALDWITSLPSRPIRPDRSYQDSLGLIDRPMPVAPTDPDKVIAHLAEIGPSGLTAMNHGRFFGWVIGGHQPAGLAADWLVAAWDQNSAMAGPTPTTSAIETVTARWVKELLDLPEEASTAFVTGGQTANFVALAAARDQVLADAGWDVETDGLQGAPTVTVIAGPHRHHTIDKALRMLGLGAGRMRLLPGEGATIDRDELGTALDESSGPTIVCAQVGEVNTGAIDPIADIVELVGDRAWLHIDGAFGLWARLDDRVSHLFDRVEEADSWATDSHKWLNTPYDCGIALTRHPDAHARAMSLRAEYIPAEESDQVRSPIDWVPEMSRRARSMPVYATLTALGRSGVVEMVRRSRDMAGAIATGIEAVDGAVLLHPVVTNQVLVRFDHSSGPDHTTRVLETVQAEGLAYPTGTTWQGLPAIRISVSNWATDETDVAITVDALARAHATAG